MAFDSYWQTLEFASQGDNLRRKSDKQPHELIHNAISTGLSDEEYFEKPSKWAVKILV